MGAKRTAAPLVKALLFPVAVILILALFFTAISNLDKGRIDQGRERLESTIREAVATCYATEGFYPPNLDYIREQYHLQLSEETYLIHYEIFADNIMPTIKVLIK